MNINHLAIFRAVAEEGSVSRGAQRLRISQPAVSKQIRELEKSLGVALFHRLSTGVQLTEAGELLAGYARRLFAIEARAERALAELKALERGRLRIGASTTIGAYLLPEVCARFQREYSGLELHVEIGNTRETQRRLLDNEVDVAFTEGLKSGVAGAPDLQASVFHQDEIVAIVPPRHKLWRKAQRGPLSPEEFCKEPLVLREEGSGTRAVVEQALGERGVEWEGSLSLGSTEAIKRAVAAGIGVAFVSRLTLATELRAKTLKIVPLAGFKIERPLHRLRRRGDYEGRAVREFVRMLREGEW